MVSPPLEGYAPASYEKARLRFAHAETLLPFSCLIGLFLKESGECLYNKMVLSATTSGFLVNFMHLNVSEFELIQREQTLQYPPKPPKTRNWRGNLVAPFAGNNMLVLYSCTSDNSSKYFVRVLHNERPIPIPVSFLITALWSFLWDDMSVSKPSRFSLYFSLLTSEKGYTCCDVHASNLKEVLPAVKLQLHETFLKLQLTFLSAN